MQKKHCDNHIGFTVDYEENPCDTGCPVCKNIVEYKFIDLIREIEEEVEDAKEAASCALLKLRDLKMRCSK